MNVFELDTEVFENCLATNHDRQVLQHGLPSIAIARCLHCGDLEGPPQLVDDQRRQGFPFDFFSNDQQWLAAVNDLFEDGNQILNAADLLFVDQNISVFQHAFHRGGISHEVR